MHSLRVKHMRVAGAHNMRVGVRTVHCAVGRCRASLPHQAHLSHRAGVSQGMVRMVRTQAGGLVCCVASSSSSSSSSSADDIIVPPLKTHIGAFETSLSSLMGLAHEHGYFAGEGVPQGVIDGSGGGLDAWLATRGGYAATKRALAQLARQHETEGNLKPVDDVHAQSLAALSCPAPNRKAANAHKRLRAWAGLEPQHPSQGPYTPGDAMGSVGLSDVLRLVLCTACAGSEQAAGAAGTWTKGPFKVGASHRAAAAAAVADVDAALRDDGIQPANFGRTMETRARRRDELFTDKQRRFQKTTKRREFRKSRSTRGYGRDAREARIRSHGAEEQDREDIDGDAVSSA